MIFIDTSFFVALRNRRDRHHQEAVAILRQRERSGFVTSNHVRGETWTYLRRKADHRSAVAFLDSLESSPRIRVDVVTPDQEARGLRWLLHHDEREYSFVDATSFALMEGLRLTEALAYDGDFAAAGFVEIRPR